MYLTGILQAFGVAALMSVYNVYIKIKDLIKSADENMYKDKNNNNS
jgi:hypothetical protein